MTVAEATRRCISWLLSMTGVRRATIYLTPKLTVKATRLHKHDRRNRCNTFIVTIGRPNYREREWIKRTKRTGESFPALRGQVWPKSRKAAK